MNDASLKYKKSKSLALTTLNWNWVLLEYIIYEFPEDPNNILFTIDIHRI